MRIPTPCVLLSLLLLSCAESRPPLVPLAAHAEPIAVCGRHPLPMKIGQFLIQIHAPQLDFLEESSITATYTAELSWDQGAVPGAHAAAVPIRLSPPSGSTLALRSNTIEVFADHLGFARAGVRFLAEVRGLRKDDQTMDTLHIGGEFSVLNTCPEIASPAQVLVETILGQRLDVTPYAMSTPVGVPTCNPSSSIPPQIPSDAFTETFEVGALVVDLTSQQLGRAFDLSKPTPSTPSRALFPEGAGPVGFTIRDDSSASYLMLPGRYLLAWQCVAGEIPLNSPTRRLQLAFLCDRDDRSSNNFFPPAPFEKDATDDTDTWYTATHDPATGWDLRIGDGQAKPPRPLAISPAAGTARVVLAGQVQLFVIPLRQLGSALPSRVPVRFATFAHEGDFGQQGGPWSADATPPIDLPRILVSVNP